MRLGRRNRPAAPDRTEGGARPSGVPSPDAGIKGENRRSSGGESGAEAAWTDGTDDGVRASVDGKESEKAGAQVPRNGTDVPDGGAQVSENARMPGAGPVELPEVPASKRIVYRSSRDYRRDTQRRSTASGWSVALSGVSAFLATAGEWMKVHFPKLTWKEFLHVLEYPFENRAQDLPRFLTLCVLPAALAMLVCGVLGGHFRDRPHFVAVMRVLALLLLALSLFLVYRFASYYQFMGQNRPFVNLFPW